MCLLIAPHRVRGTRDPCVWTLRTSGVRGQEAVQTHTAPCSARLDGLQESPLPRQELQRERGGGGWGTVGLQVQPALPAGNEGLGTRGRGDTHAPAPLGAPSPTRPAQGASPETPQTPAAPLGGAAPVARAGCGPGGGWDRDAAVCVRVRGGRAGSGCARGGDDRCRRRAGDTRVSAGCAGSAERLGARGAGAALGAGGAPGRDELTAVAPGLSAEPGGGGAAAALGGSAAPGPRPPCWAWTRASWGRSCWSCSGWRCAPEVSGRRAPGGHVGGGLGGRGGGSGRGGAGPSPAETLGARVGTSWAVPGLGSGRGGGFVQLDTHGKGARSGRVCLGGQGGRGTPYPGEPALRYPLPWVGLRPLQGVW